MKKYAKAAAIVLALAVGGATAASAQVGTGRPLEPTYSNSGSVVARHDLYDAARGAIAPIQCTNDLNGAINAGRSPSARYPVPDTCTNT
jgi:hypothetical protein